MLAKKIEFRELVDEWMMDARSSITVRDEFFCVQVKMIGRNRKLVHGSFSMGGVWTRRGKRGDAKHFGRRLFIYFCAFTERLIPQPKI